MDNFFDSLYMLTEIGINLNFSSNQLKRLAYLMNQKELEKIINEFPELEKFIPYCRWYEIQNKNVLCISAYMYDLYRDTGILPNLNNCDIDPDTNKLEHWMYINPIVFQINPEEGFEFANKYFPNCDIWNLFLSGSARMDYYEGVKTPLEQRIKYAIVEYMMRRMQFYSTEDFNDNTILHKKYGKKGGKKDG